MFRERAPFIVWTMRTVLRFVAAVFVICLSHEGICAASQKENPRANFVALQKLVALRAAEGQRQQPNVQYDDQRRG